MAQDVMAAKVRDLLKGKSPAYDFFYIRHPYYAGKYAPGEKLYYIGDTQVEKGVYEYLRSKGALKEVGPYVSYSKQYKIDFEKAKSRKGR